MAEALSPERDRPASEPEVVLQCSFSSTGSSGGAAPLPRAGFYYLGALTLLGWNMILAFTHAFDSDMLGGRTWGGSGWAFWCAMFNSMLVNIVQGSLSSRKINDLVPFTIKYILGCVLLAVALVGLMYLKVTTDAPSEEAAYNIFVKALIFVCVQGMSSALLSSAVFSLAGSIDQKLTMDAMIGQGLGGVFAAVVGFICGDSEKGLVLSFAACALFGLVGMPVYFCRVRRNFHVRARETPQDTPSRRSLSSSAGGSPVLIRRSSSFRILQRAAWPQCVTVCFVFVVTFVVFPGVTSQWRGNHIAALIATFQLVDVVGRFAPHLEFFHVRKSHLVSLFSFLRVLFIPAFLIVERGESALVSSVWVQLSLMIAFAFTNGYVSTLSMMLGPGQRGLDVDEAAPAGSLMSFFLVFGILIGSLLALLTNIK